MDTLGRGCLRSGNDGKKKDQIIAMGGGNSGVGIEGRGRCARLSREWETRNWMTGPKRGGVSKMVTWKSYLATKKGGGEEMHGVSDIDPKNKKKTQHKRITGGGGGGLSL